MNLEKPFSYIWHSKKNYEQTKVYFSCYPFYKLYRIIRDMDKNQYIPGNCNIGETEIRVRQKFLLLALLLTVVFTIITHLTHSVIALFFLFAVTYATIVLFIEVTTRFCVLFGFFSLHNFKGLGNLDNVDNCRCRNKDRKRAIIVLLGSVLLTIPYVWMVYRLACCHQPT